MTKKQWFFTPATFPISGLLDCRSTPDQIETGYGALVKNLTANAAKRVCRLPGWQSFGLHDNLGSHILSDNSDLHDQLISNAVGYSGEYPYCGEVLEYRPYCDTNYATLGGMESITLLKEFQSGSGARKLIAGTRSRIYARNAVAHNWKIIADGLGGEQTCGCSGRRFRVAQLGDVLIFTNNYDSILAWRFDDPSSGCDLQAANTVDDLVGLGVDKAYVAVEYKGFVFLMNLEIDGVRYVAKAIWSDYGDPLSWSPAANDGASLAGDSDIGDPGEAILAAEKIGDYLFVYKERSIWRVTLVDIEAGLFNFQQVYRGENVLRFPNSLVSVGDSHFFLSHDDIYTIDLYSQQPQPVEWMSRASGIIFSEETFSSDDLVGGIEFSECEQAVGGWDALHGHLWFSWVSKLNGDDSSVAETTVPGTPILHSINCPNRSLVFNLQYKTSSYVDHGFSAFCLFRDYDGPSLNDWLITLGACDEGELDTDPKAGTAYYYPPLEPTEVAVDCIWNATEDPDLPSSETSLCAVLGDVVWEDICQGCDAGTMFLMASAADMTVKQYSEDTYHREHFDYPTQLYSAIGYDTVMESGALSFSIDAEKHLNRLMVEFVPPTQSPVPNLYCRLGQSSQPSCSQWFDLTPQPLKCQTDGVASQKAYDKAYFNRLMRGRYLFYRVWVTGTTGATCFSRIEAMIRRAEARPA